VPTFTPETEVAGRAGVESKRFLSLVFGLTIFTSACLLFSVQPLASKLILPWFGGSAGVWITCMLFFQAGLLLGYSYAHEVSNRLSMRRQVLLHAVLLGLSVATLPILPNAIWHARPGDDPVWLVLGALATSVGLPYLLLASTSPLLQSWYAGVRQGALPYRYFALSNAGSLVALVSYPILIEPHWTSHDQAWMWSVSFGAFAVLCIGTAVAAHREHPVIPRSIAPRHTAETTQIALWISLAACASTLLLTVTNLATQNIAPVPLLWVVPLGTYLLTFVLCFDSDRWYKRAIFLPLLFPAMGCLAAATGPLTNRSIRLEVPLLIGALFVCSMACHGELARLKPSAEQLTKFYLCVAAGGALGGVFVALVAPHWFRAMYECSIAFVGCPFLLLAVLWRERSRWTKPNLALSLWLAAVAATIVLAGYLGREIWRQEWYATRLVRNFYGALRVDEFEDHHQKIRELRHGTITHGLQFLRASLRHVPTTYYGWDSGIGLTWQVLAPSGPLRMGVIGLGAGTLAAYGRGGDTLRFYEINPAVIQIAETQFTYLADCPSHVDIVLGDARRSMTAESSQRYDLLVIDAFSGDAIPVHLLTREAFGIYWRHLKQNGVLAVHVSNHYLNLAPVVKLIAEESGKEAWEVDNYDDDSQEVYTSTYVLVTTRPGFFDSVLLGGQLTKIDVPHGLHAWTDDYSNLWQLLNFK
jgi:spermidine synthase